MFFCRHNGIQKFSILEEEVYWYRHTNSRKCNTRSRVRERAMLLRIWVSYNFLNASLAIILQKYLEQPYLVFSVCTSSHVWVSIRKMRFIFSKTQFLVRLLLQRSPHASLKLFLHFHFIQSLRSPFSQLRWLLFLQSELSFALINRWGAFIILSSGNRNFEILSTK